MLKLYVTKDNDNVINKTIVFKREYGIKFKEVTSITSPVITLQIDDEFNLLECNYCYVSEFSRYYFIHDIQVLNDDMYRLTLDCDVLESFKDDILNSYAEITRNVQTGDYLNFSSNMDVRKDIEIYESVVSLEKKNTIILSTIGSGN